MQNKKKQMSIALKCIRSGISCVWSSNSSNNKLSILFIYLFSNYRMDMKLDELECLCVAVLYFCTALVHSLMKLYDFIYKWN